MLNILAGVALVFTGSPAVAHAQVLEAASSTVYNLPESPESIVRRIQTEYGLGDDFYKTASCESQFKSHAVGDNNESFGMWQINKPSHPTISKEHMFDPEWSTKWAAEQFKEGRAYLWTCWRSLNDQTRPLH